MLLDGLTDAIYRGRAYHAAVDCHCCLGKKWVDEEGAREKFLIAQGRDMKFQELFLQRTLKSIMMGIVGKEGCLLSLRGGKDISSQQRREERAMFILFII